MSIRNCSRSHDDVSLCLVFVSHHLNESLCLLSFRILLFEGHLHHSHSPNEYCTNCLPMIASCRISLLTSPHPTICPNLLDDRVIICGAGHPTCRPLTASDYSALVGVCVALPIIGILLYCSRGFCSNSEGLAVPILRPQLSAEPMLTSIPSGGSESGLDMTPISSSKNTHLVAFAQQENHR